MLRYALAGIIGLVSTSGLAQPATPQNDPPATSATQAPAANAPAASESDVKPGDRWVYEERDEITGTIRNTRTNIVTEVTPTEIATRFTNAGKPDASLIVFDRSWNVILGGPWRYSPHDGTGIQMPLEVGKTWRIRSNEISGANGQSWKRSGTSKVVGRETLTTKAGTFETFKIETSLVLQNAKDPTRKTAVAIQTWYAPTVNHWIKRKRTIRANDRLMADITTDLIEYGRKQ